MSEHECAAACSGEWDECKNDMYTAAPDRIRICNDGTGDRPWQVDGYRADNRHYTVEVWNFHTWGEAIASVPAFIKEVCP